MTAATLTAFAARTAPDRAGRALIWLAVRQIRVGALVVLAVTAGMTGLVAGTASAIVDDPVSTESLRALASNPAIRTLFGEPIALDTVGGFTVWRSGTPLAMIVAAWTIVATTRILRGEEAAGHWDLLLAGRTPLRGVVARHLMVAIAAPVVAGGAVAAVLAATGAGVQGALVHGTGLALLGVFFAGTAALAAQLFSTRTAATTAAVAVLGASLLARMIGDGVDALGWLRWASPIGLMALTRPFADDRWLPLLLLGLAAAVVCAAAYAASGRRDLAAGLLPGRPPRPARTALLGSVDSFAVRRAIGPVIAWSLALAAYFLLVGATAQSALDFLADNPIFTERAAAAGFGALASVEGFAATLFAILAMPVGGFVAVRIAAFAEAEADRRLTPLAAGPLTRERLLAAEIAATTGGAVALTIVAGLAMWAGTALGDGDTLGVGAALTGALNSLPVVLLCLGASVLALAWAPRAVAALGGLPAAGGFLLYALALDAGAPTWVINLSPYAHLAAVPLDEPHWIATGVMTALAATGIVAGTLHFRARDLRG